MSWLELPTRCACGENGAVLDAQRPAGVSLDFMVMELAAGQGYALHVDADQWFGLTATKRSYIPGTDPPQFADVDRVYVQCDRIIDGVWAILDHLGPHEDFH